MRDGAVMSLGIELDGPAWGRSKKELQVPIIKIETVKLKIVSGDAAYITGIDTTSTDCLEGYVHFLSGEQVQVFWDTEGNARGHDHSFRLSAESKDSAEFDALKESALHLVVPRIKNQLGYA
ncbi:TPA: hypothetical protein ACXLB5_000887 [Pseudomonas aeruginosa]